MGTEKCPLVPPGKHVCHPERSEAESRDLRTGLLQALKWFLGWNQWTLLRPGVRGSLDSTRDDMIFSAQYPFSRLRPFAADKVKSEEVRYFPSENGFK